MAAPNTKPIMPLTPNVGGFTKLTAANTATDGTGTVATLVTGGANGGTRIDKVRCVPGGTNIATVLRLFLNNGSTNATATNNVLIAEIALPATTASNASPNGPTIDVPIGLSIPSNYKLNACLGTAVSAGWHLLPVTGDY